MFLPSQTTSISYLFSSQSLAKPSVPAVSNLLLLCVLFLPHEVALLTSIQIEKKMHRFNPSYNALHAADAGTDQDSAATTPPPLTSDTRSVQTSSVASINGDAIEGAHIIAPGSRKGSVPTGEPILFENGH